MVYFVKNPAAPIFQKEDVVMGKEIYFMIKPAELARRPPIKLSCPPLIDTDTQKLGVARWHMSYRQNMYWGRPKIRIYDPCGSGAVSIKLKNGNPFRPDVWLNPDSLWDHLQAAGAACYVPSTLGFQFGVDPQEELNDLKSELEAVEKSKAVLWEQYQMLRNTKRDPVEFVYPQVPPATIINNLQSDLMSEKHRNERLLKELDTLRGTLNIMEVTPELKHSLRREIVHLKAEVEVLKDQLHVYENEDSLDIINRLNQESYSKYAADRPRRQRERNEMMERIFATVDDLLEKILHDTKNVLVSESQLT